MLPICKTLKTNTTWFWNVRVTLNYEGKIFPVITIFDPLCFKFIELISTENKRVVRKLAKYICHALNVRDNLDLNLRE